MTVSTFEKVILDHVNEYRQSKGLSLLHFEPHCQMEARAHLRAIVEGSRPFGHEGFPERARRIIRAIGGKTAAENLAQGNDDPAKILAYWLQSPPHTQNIEGNYTHTGVAVLQDAQGTLLVNQIFIQNPEAGIPKVTVESSDPEVAEAPTQSVQALDTARIEQEIFQQVNQYRQSLGLSPLKIHPEVQHIARIHSQNMATAKIPYGHQGFQMRMDLIMERTGAHRGAENVATRAYSAEVVVQAWIDSPLHHKNIIGPYTYTGIAVEQNADGETFFTHFFSA